MKILHQEDVSDAIYDVIPKYGTGIALKRLEDPDGSNVRYFVRWPESNNNISAGWYKTDQIVVLGTTY